MLGDGALGSGPQIALAKPVAPKLMKKLEGSTGFVSEN